MQLGFDNSLFGKWSMAAREEGRKEGRRDGETCFGEFEVDLSLRRCAAVIMVFFEKKP